MDLLVKDYAGKTKWILTEKGGKVNLNRGSKVRRGAGQEQAKFLLFKALSFTE
jgi:hypothetical protein